MSTVAQRSLLEQMHIDDLEIQRRKELLGITQADEELLARVSPIILQRLDEIVDDFYEQQISIEEIALIIGDSETLERLHQAQKRYVSDLFSGFYDQNYVNNRLRIGLVHKRIGVEPKHYLSAVRSLRQILRNVLAESISNGEVRAATLDSLDKLFFFDVEFVFDTYIRSLIAEIESAKDKAVQYASILEERVAERTRELEHLSRSDPLTGLLNLRAFREELRHELARLQRYPEKLSLIYFDVDDFKKINDTVGHHEGDAVLKTIGRLLLESKRESDLVARYGGDEFCVALPDTDPEGARQFCSRLEHEFGLAYQNHSLSIGIAQANAENTDGNVDELLRAADRNMYEAKKRRHREASHSVSPPEKKESPD